MVLPLLSALLLAACGKDPGLAFTDTRTPPSLGPQFWAPDGWAWGTVKIEGAPENRYGVAAPAIYPEGPVMVILTGYGESAETYFETVRDLNARGWTVWVMEPHGQGGSGKLPGTGDIGQSAGFDKDVAAVRYLIENVIRPRDRDLTLAAHGSSASVALMLLESGFRRVQRLFLWDADLAPVADPDRAAGFTRFGLGGLRASGAEWKRPTVNITRRATLPLAWPVANPDLRMGGPGYSWVAAKDAAVRQATAPAALQRITTPLVIHGAMTRGSPPACPPAPTPCTLMAAGPANPHLAADPARLAWLDVLAPAPAPVPSRDDHAR